MDLFEYQARDLFAAHDVPVLVLPGHPLMDHPALGRAVAAAGVGRSLHRKTSVDALRLAVGALASDGPHRTAAAAFGARIRALDPAGAAVAHLHDVMALEGRQ